ncbi:MAG: alanine racemase [Clostridia bacterium]|nr:alanine racemase [Clostridia bacterium]
MNTNGPKIEIDLGAIKENYLSIKKILNKGAIAASVVKADAYGLGAKKVSCCLYEAGCRDFWVAYINEAVDIRKVLPIDANIYVLQGFEKSYIDLIKTHKIIHVINSIEELQAAKNNDITMVLHIDTGLSRLGIRDSDIGQMLEIIKYEKIDHIMSHFSSADEENNPITLGQKNKFDFILSKIKQNRAGISATAGTLLGPDFHYDIVRLGAFLYGIKTNETFQTQPKNVLRLKTRIIQKYEIEEKSAVGYGATFITSRKTKIAVLSIGYADGIKRSLSNRGTVLFYDADKNSYQANIIGNISMDLLTCDVTDVPDCLTNVNDMAYLLDENYSINDMAKDAGTIPYEVLTSINFKSERYNVEYI